MFGLALRITAVMTAALLTVVLATAVAIYLQNRADGSEAQRFPLPERVAAMVELLESVPEDQRQRVLAAVNTPEVQVRIEPGPFDAVARPEVPLPWLGWITQRYLATLGNRRIVAGLSEDFSRGSRLRRLLRRDMEQMEPLRMLVELRDGQVLVVELRSERLRGLLQRPFVLGGLISILFVSLVATWVLKRQIRPLEALSRAAESVGTTQEARPVVPAGAPEVRKLVSAFERMRERLRLLLESRTRMLGAISHDLGTYLTRLRLRIEYIDDAEQRARAERDLQSMQQLLSDALTLARLDHDVGAADVVDLQPLVEQQLRGYRDGGATVSLAAAAVARVRGQPAALSRVVNNLVGNALKYAGSAEVSLLRQADEVELRVDDHGPGIPAAERDRVLEPFYRADPARNLDTPGSGLGLSIVADIVRRHGGRLVLDDVPGGGLRVRVLLPAA